MCKTRLIVLMAYDLCNFSTLIHLIYERIARFDIGENNFTGTVPEEIYGLVNLHTLDVSANRFSGNISSSIGNLDKMKFLDLSDNFFDCHHHFK